MFGVEFRPLDFESVYGLNEIKEILRAILRQGVYDPGYLLSGPYSTGKTTLAQLFARSILCSNRKEDMSPCNECPSCKDFISNTNAGYLEVDAANNGTKERIQEIKESLSYESITKYKIVLFDEAHNMSKEAKDALLSQLEKKGTNIIMIFCTTELDKMPDTISSRCMQFQLQEPSESYVISKLEKICQIKGFKYDKDALFDIVKSVGTHYRDAENKLRQVSLLGDITLDNVAKTVTFCDDGIVEMLVNLPGNLSESMKIANYLVSRMAIKDLYESILRIVKDTILFSVGASFHSEHYGELLGKMKKKFNGTAYDVLDYMLLKNRFSDSNLFLSDMLVLHYKFIRGQFTKEMIQNPQGEASKNTEEGFEKEKDPAAEMLKKAKNLQPWEREEAVRNFKMSKKKDGEDQRVTEKVSQSWGQEVKEIPSQIRKKEVSKKEFDQIVLGSQYGEKI